MSEDKRIEKSNEDAEKLRAEVVEANKKVLEAEKAGEAAKEAKEKAAKKKLDGRNQKQKGIGDVIDANKKIDAEIASIAKADAEEKKLTKSGKVFEKLKKSGKESGVNLKDKDNFYKILYSQTIINGANDHFSDPDNGKIGFKELRILAKRELRNRDTPFFGEEKINKRFENVPSANLKENRIFAYLDHDITVDGENKNVSRKEIINKLSRRITIYGQSGSEDFYINELKALRVWFYKNPNGRSYLQSKVEKAFKARTKKEKKEEKAEYKEVSESKGINIDMCGADNETAVIDITEDEFLSILSPNGPACLFCHKEAIGYDKIASKLKNTVGATKMGFFDCEACRRDKTPESEVENHKKLFKLLTIQNKFNSGKRGDESNPVSQNNLTWDVLKEFIISGKIPKPKKITFDTEDKLSITDVILKSGNDTKSTKPIILIDYLKKLIFKNIINYVYGNFNNILNENKLKIFNNVAAKKICISILKTFYEIVDKKINKKKIIDLWNEGDPTFVESLKDTDNRNEAGELLYKKGSIGKFKNIEIKNIINITQKVINDSIIIKKINDFKFIKNFIYKLFDIYNAIKNIDYTSIFESIESYFESDSLSEILINVDWTDEKDNININFINELYFKNKDVEWDFGKRNDEEIKMTMPILLIPIKYESDDVYDEKSQEGEKSDDQSDDQSDGYSTVQSPMVWNWSKYLESYISTNIKISKYIKGQGKKTDDEIIKGGVDVGFSASMIQDILKAPAQIDGGLKEQMLSTLPKEIWKQHQGLFGVPLDEFNPIKLNKLNVLMEKSKNKEQITEFNWFVPVPSAEDELKIGMKIEIDYLNDNVLVEVVDDETNRTKINGYKGQEGKKQAMINLKIKYVDLYSTGAWKAIQDNYPQIQKDVPTYGKNISDFEMSTGEKMLEGSIIGRLTFKVVAPIVGWPALFVLGILGSAAAMTMSVAVTTTALVGFIGVRGPLALAQSAVLRKKITKAWTKSGAEKLYVKNLLKEKNVKTLESIHLVINGGYKKDGKDYADKFFGFNEGEGEMNEGLKEDDLNIFVEKLKKYIAPSIEDNGNTFKQKYKIYFHYIPERVDLNKIEDLTLKMNQSKSKTIQLIEEDKKLKQLCNDECMNNLMEEARSAKIENPCGTTFCYRNVDDAKNARRSKKKISNAFYLNHSEDTEFVIPPPHEIVFVPEKITYANASEDIIQLSGKSKDEPGIITLKTTLPNVKTNFNKFFTKLFDPKKFKNIDGKNTGVLIFNKICVDYEIKDEIIPILKNLRNEKVVFKNITIVNSEVISIYNILYLLRKGGVKFNKINITGVEDSNKDILEKKKKIKWR